MFGRKPDPHRRLAARPAQLAHAALSRVIAAAFLVAVAVGAGCGVEASTSSDESESEREPETAVEPAPADAPLVVFLGDSLTAGYGLPSDASFPAVIARALAEEGQPIRMVNAGVSGDTSAGGLSRLGWLLEQSPDVLVVGLGGNDGLRGLPPASTRENLRTIVERARDADASVLLLGIKMPPNYGPDYTAEFAGLYGELAEELDVPLVPFMLEGVAGDRSLNQGDGIHPTAAGQRIVAENVLPALRALLESGR